jgi:hypothetical protein
VALASTQFTNLKRHPMGAGRWMVTGRFTGPASYTSGGEDFTNALAKSSIGIARVNSLVFNNLIDNDNAALSIGLEFDHARTSTSQGKIRAINLGQSAHLHSFLVKGSQAAAGTDAVSSKGSSPNVIGKESATDLTSLGGATNGGVQNSTATAAGSEVTAATDLSGYICEFVAIGC